MKKVWVIKELNYCFSMSPFLRSNFSQSVSRTVRDFLRKLLEEQRLLASDCLSFLLPGSVSVHRENPAPSKPEDIQCAIITIRVAVSLLLTDVRRLSTLLITSFHELLVSVSYLFIYF